MPFTGRQRAAPHAVSAVGSVRLSCAPATGETGASVKDAPSFIEARLLRAGPPPDVGCSVDDDVVYPLGLGEHRHMA